MKIRAWGGLAASTIALTGLARAAETDANSLRASAEDSAVLEEVVVSAQHRVENLQEVPISAQVIDGNTLAQQNLTSLDSASQTVPSVHIGGAGGRGGFMFIRGVGSGNNQSFDQSVGVFVDDIYHGRQRITSATFLDLDRIEVLKGPQTTYFGNNAIAGAFNVITRQPGSQFDASVRALASPRSGTNGGQYAIEGAVGAPINDVFSVRAAATYNGQNGWLENVNTGEHVPEEENIAGRISLRFAPNDDFDATLKLEAGTNQNDGGLYMQDVNCPPPAPFTPAGFCNTVLALGLPVGIDNTQYSLNPGSQIALDTYEGVLTAHYQVSDHSLTSVTGYYGYDYNMDIDTDGTPLTLLHGHIPERYHQFSQELRLASPTGRRFEYLAGVYFQKDGLYSQVDLTYSFLNANLNAAPAASPLRALIPYLPIAQEILFSQDETSYSVFGSLTWNISEQLKLTGGLRRSRVEKEYDWQLLYATGTELFGGLEPLPASVANVPAALGLGVPNAFGDDRTDSAWMPSARLQYQINPQTMTYVSYTRGFKAGGFNAADNTGLAANLPFDPEFVDAYEVGLKSEWFDNRLLLNAAVFRSDYQDLQASINFANAAGTFISLVRNAAESRSRGVEIETAWAATQRLRLSAAVTYLDSTYLSYPNAGPTNAQAGAGIRVQDLSGRPTQFAPKWAGTLTGSYRADLPGEFRLTTAVTGIFRDRQFIQGTDDPLHEAPSVTRLDARLTLEPPGGHWAFDLIGKNLTDREIVTFSADMPVSRGSLLQQREQPRNIAVQARYDF